MDQRANAINTVFGDVGHLSANKMAILLKSNVNVNLLRQNCFILSQPHRFFGENTSKMTTLTPEYRFCASCYMHFFRREIMHCEPGLPDGTFSNQKSQIGYISEGLAVEDVGIFYYHLVYYISIWYFYGHLVCCIKTNLATLLCADFLPPSKITHRKITFAAISISISI
jgi:hypothetical protein